MSQDMDSQALDRRRKVQAERIAINKVMKARACPGLRRSLSWPDLWREVIAIRKSWDQYGPQSVDRLNRPVGWREQKLPFRHSRASDPQ